MPKLLVCVTDVRISDDGSRRVQITVNISTDWVNPHTGEPLEIDNLPLEVNLANSISQINTAIRSSLLSMLVTLDYNTGMSPSDVILFGAAT